MARYKISWIVETSADASDLLDLATEAAENVTENPYGCEDITPDLDSVTVAEVSHYTDHEDSIAASVFSLRESGPYLSKVAALKLVQGIEYRFLVRRVHLGRLSAQSAAEQILTDLRYARGNR